MFRRLVLASWLPSFVLGLSKDATVLLNKRAFLRTDGCHNGPCESPQDAPVIHNVQSQSLVDELLRGLAVAATAERPGGWDEVVALNQQHQGKDFDMRRAVPSHNSDMLLSASYWLAVLVSLMCVARVLQGLVGDDTRATRALDVAVVSVDVFAWYLATSINLAASKELMVLGGGLGDAIALSFSQTAAGALVMLCWPLLDRKNGPMALMKLPPSVVRVLACASFCTYVGACLVLLSLRVCGVSTTANVRALEPCITVVVMVMLGKDQISAMQIVCVMVASLALIVTAQGSAEYDLKALCFPGLATVAYSCARITMHDAATAMKQFPSIITFGIANGIALVFATVCMVGLQMSPYAIELPVFLKNWRLVLLTSLSFVVYSAASFFVLLRLEPTQHGILLAGKRVFAVGLAYLLVREPLSTLEIGGLVVTSAAITCFEFQRPPKKK